MNQITINKLLIALVATFIWLPYLFTAPFNLFDKRIVYQEGGLFPWIILFFCGVWLFSRRDQLLSSIGGAGYLSKNTSHRFQGIIACLLSLVLAPAVGGPSLPRRLFPVLLFVGGIFTMFGATLPMILSAIYGVGIFLPILIKTFLEIPYSVMSVRIFTSILRVLGYPVRSDGPRLYISTTSGETIRTYVDSICAGSSSLTVFMVLFVLVTLDLGLNPSWGVVAFFLAGCLGTYAQAILRLITISLIGFHFGEDALWQTHVYLGYLLFVIYFSAFIYLYLRWAKRRNVEGSGFE